MTTSPEPLTGGGDDAYPLGPSGGSRVAPAVSDAWEGPEAMREWLIPVAALTPAPKNPRRGQIELIKESLIRFGQVRPILYSEANEIIAGNHTYRAAVALGWTHVAAILNRFDSPEEARAYLVADNRIPELGSYDEPQLLNLLEDVETTGSWEGTGYTADDLDDLRAAQGLVAETEEEAFTGDFAVSAEELAARAQALEAGRTFSEIVLLLGPEQAANFETYTRILQKHYEVSGATETVLRAVVAAADRA